MRRISRTLGCLVIALASSASLAACRDAVGGQGARVGSFAAEVEATSGVSGENPTGRVGFFIGAANGPNWHGQVSCLSVRGNTAFVGFGEGYFQVPGQRSWVTGLVRIVDNGPGPGDTFEYVELEAGERENHSPPPTGDPLPGPTECSTFPPGQTVYVMDEASPVSRGFRVNDALPLRASNE
jgi:hypothetical protein